MRMLTLAIDETAYALLEVLTCGEYGPDSVEGVLLELIDHAQQGVYRPGAWERGWLVQAFGDEWIANLECGDPYGRENSEHLFQRPKGWRPRRKR